MNPRYNEQISPRFPWHFVKSRFQSIKLSQQFFKEMYKDHSREFTHGSVVGLKELIFQSDSTIHLLFDFLPELNCAMKLRDNWAQFLLASAQVSQVMYCITCDGTILLCNN